MHVRRDYLPKEFVVPKSPERILFCGWQCDMEDMVMVTWLWIQISILILFWNIRLDIMQSFNFVILIIWPCCTDSSSKVVSTVWIVYASTYHAVIKQCTDMHPGKINVVMYRYATTYLLFISIPGIVLLVWCGTGQQHIMTWV